MNTVQGTAALLVATLCRSGALARNSSLHSYAYRQGPKYLDRSDYGRNTMLLNTEGLVNGTVPIFGDFNGDGRTE